MTVYEALVQAQHEACEMSRGCGVVLAVMAEPNIFNVPKTIAKEQSAIDRAYLLGVAIDNLPIDIAGIEI